MCQKDEGMKKKGGHAETVSFKQFFFVGTTAGSQEDAVYYNM